MTLAAVLVLLGLGALAVATLVIVVRGGRGPADPPASHARVDPAGFPVPPAPRGVLTRVPGGARTGGPTPGRTPARDLSSAPVRPVGVRSA